MEARSSLRLFAILATLAALLALSAAVIRYVRMGELEATWIGGGVFLSAIAIGAWMRLRGGPVA